MDKSGVPTMDDANPETQEQRGDERKACAIPKTVQLMK